MPSTSSASRPASSRASWIASTAVSEMGRPMSLAKGRWPMPTIATRSWMRRNTGIRLARASATVQMRPDPACEFGDRVEQRRAREHVVVMTAGQAHEAFRLVRRGEQALTEREGHDLVAIAVGNADRDGEGPDAGERVEALADQDRDRPVVAASDIAERRPRGDDGHAGARAGGGQVDRDGARQGFARADDRQAPIPHAVVGGLRVEVDPGLARPALAAPVAPIVVGQHVDTARRELERDVDASGDVPRVAVLPDEHGPALASPHVPGMETDLLR